jgi:hypothetical protein
VKLDESRVGDNAPMARIEFVDEIKDEVANKKASEAKPSTSSRAKRSVAPSTGAGEAK